VVYGRGDGAGGGVGVASSEWRANNLVVQRENAKKNLRIEKMYIDLTRIIGTVTYKTQKMRMSIGLTRSVNNLHPVVNYAY